LKLYENLFFKSAFDASSSGYINFSEFLIAISVTSFGDLHEKAELAFKILDLSKIDKIF
jgi:Ca2+-binding EF-hand superfamily protein